MTPPMTPREKVAQIIKEKVSGPHFTDPSHFVAMEQDRFIAADAILSALASGSGDHTELARLAETATPGPWHRGNNDNGSSQGEMSVWPDPQMRGGIIARCGWQMPWDGWHEQPAKDAAFIAAANPATVLALLAENAALRAERDALLAVDEAGEPLRQAHRDRATEAERKLAEERLNYEGALSDIDSLLTVLIRRINGEKDLASAAEWVRLNYPLAAEKIISKEAERG